MSALLLYGIVLPPDAMASLAQPGVAGAALRLVTQAVDSWPRVDAVGGQLGVSTPPAPVARCAALVSALVDRQLLKQPPVAEVLAFQQAISAWHQHGAVLPARFGCLVRDEDALRGHLRARQLDYLAALQRVAGCEEMGVRVTLPAPPPSTHEPAAPGQASGASFLRARQQHYARLASVDQEAVQIAERLERALAPHVRQALVLPPRREAQTLAVTVAFLVARADLPAFRAALAALAPEPAGRRTLLGPWPPFSFTPAASESPDATDAAALGGDPL